ncbi:amidohydrolase family protein [Streptomyces sp. AD55]|uniref:amidohydrolase family protein n=1 Tax=Streptomyces sp. AD55 TaxID=3242895 RepID=UPI003529C906
MTAHSYDMILADAMIANAEGTFRGSVAVKDGRIADVWHAAEPHEPRADQVIDCSDRWLLPGGVDPHVHVGITFGDTVTSEGHLQCSRAALAGGTTTMVDFAIPQPGQTPLEAVRRRLEAADGTSLADYALHGCFTDRDADRVEEIGKMADLGVRTIKVYTTYRDEMMAGDDLIHEIMTALRPYGGLTYVHAEDNSVIERRMEELGRAGDIPFGLIRSARPEEAEDRAVRHVIAMARQAGAPVYFVHQSTATALETTRAARAAGVAAYSEVCPHYMLLDETLYDGEAGECFTCCPPLRSRATVDAVAAMVAAGEVDTLGSDHCAFRTEHKTPNTHDLRRMPFGMPGVQTRMVMTLSEMFIRRRVPMSTLVALLSTRPAMLSGLYPRKGVIRAGSDADLVVWDPRGTSVIAGESLLQDSDYSPFEGWTVHGSIHTVYRGGVAVYGDGAQAAPGPGSLLGSAPVTLPS